ncbi:MAG: ribulose-phosphate 3-epimerase [Gemmatimonadetes bacterium]|nr:ribulose-phosphate 3-epimerase [Gemmatimonadota bacterium]MBK9549150.1 ribulose-phosphate 3-epimerase [Gemmatimonadota bacterium]MBP6571809.1 ribulose-phosphate 3-epimerase [Gemmatimonadales bacterium]MBP9897599.1 ribulose-phosphate 3-epimerase [Gemmatimonadales bacterium]
MNIQIAPSVLSCDLGRLREQIAEAEVGGAAWLHVDVMDGHFVPNLTFGAPMIRALRKLSTLPIDVHLMVEKPEQYLAEYAELGAAVFAFHPESTIHVQRHLAAARERGMKAGLVLNPSTSVSCLEEVIDDLDLVLIMSVNPGFGGQGYLPASTGKIRRVRELLDRHGRQDVILEVDGGITTKTIRAAVQAGADTFVAGTAVFGQPDIAGAVRALHRAADGTEGS